MQKHRKYRCFGSILGLQEKENIVNSVVLSLMGEENIVNYDVLGTFLNASFRTRQCGQAKNIVKYSVFLFFRYPYLQIIVFSLAAKHRKYHGFGLVCALPSFRICAGSRRVLAPRARARAPNETVFLGVFGARARAARNNNNNNNNNHNHNHNHNNNNKNNNNNNNNHNHNHNLNRNDNHNHNHNNNNNNHNHNLNHNDNHNHNHNNNNNDDNNHQKPATATQHELTLSSPALPVGALALE